MLHPSPTTKIDPTLTRTTIDAVCDEDSPCVCLSFANTNYKLCLDPATDMDELRSMVGKTVLGTIHATARRIDAVSAGGRSIDPVAGCPRRIMGKIIGIDTRSNGLVINVGPDMAVWLMVNAPDQHAKDFAEVEFITCDIEPGASFKFKELA
ncbi:MAG: hypothetical protein JKY43_01140 [Phycisphaerales bacterium]|nr:hypothetical protein [Phycisphaerales bacterium]